MSLTWKFSLCCALSCACWGQCTFWSDGYSVYTANYGSQVFDHLNEMQFTTITLVRLIIKESFKITMLNGTGKFWHRDHVTVRLSKMKKVRLTSTEGAAWNELASKFPKLFWIIIVMWFVSSFVIVLDLLGRKINILPTAIRNTKLSLRRYLFLNG